MGVPASPSAVPHFATLIPPLHFVPLRNAFGGATLPNAKRNKARGSKAGSENFSQSTQRARSLCKRRKKKKIRTKIELLVDFWDFRGLIEIALNES